MLFIANLQLLLHLLSEEIVIKVNVIYLKNITVTTKWSTDSSQLIILVFDFFNELLLFILHTK